MTFVGPQHFRLHEFLPPLAKKKKLKIIFYNCIGIKRSIIQAELYSFFLLSLKKLKHFYGSLKESWALGTVPTLSNGYAGPEPVLSKLLVYTVQVPSRLTSLLLVLKEK